MTDDLLKRLLQPPFGTETSERNLMAEAAAQIEAANARVLVLDETLARCKSALDPNMTKAEYIGEIHIDVFRQYEDDDGDMIETCEKYQLTWTAMKEFMAMIRTRAELEPKP